MRATIRTVVCTSVHFFISIAVQAQQQDPVVQAWLQEHRTSLGLTVRDVAQCAVTSASTDKRGDRFVYVQQQVNGLPVQGAVANFAVRSGRVVSFGNRLIADVAAQAPSPAPGMDASEALVQAAKQLGLSPSAVSLLRTVDATTFELSPAGIAKEPVKAKLIYQPVQGEGLKLAWDLTIRSNTTDHWWHLAVDAITGRIIRTNDYTRACRLPQGSFAHPRIEAPVEAPMDDDQPTADGSAYRVFALPLESPSFGPRTLVTAPADVDASPYGWHDTNGADGAEYTITRGNNVYASDDINNDDLPGYSPDGGAGLHFDFPFTTPQPPVNNLDAAITNLFYMCNTLHDIWYHYGFDEAAGNYQAMDYTGTGAGNDEVLADAQDGGGTNNANFSAPPDGTSGRMQMYTWTTSTEDNSLVVNAPNAIAGPYDNVPANFGPPPPSAPITADVVLVQDGTAPASDGCDPLINGAALLGKIALVDRGLCPFVNKVQAAQDAGALAVIVVNDQAGASFAMGGTSGSITIPSVMISNVDGTAMENALLNGPLNATLQGHDATNDRDGDVDNGVIAHEYGHGVSIRLTGGAADSDCLSNAEQMGEGWSDWMALALTMEPGDQGTDARGIGTYVINEPVTGIGIRPAPYSTDFSVNDYTYAATNNVNQLSDEHGIGFVWATMLWDMTWSMINAHGFNADMFHGTGGNNIAMQIVIDGLKLQPCSPGFVDGRNAILRADTLDYGGADACLIWNSFAHRGLGYSADQGSSFSRTDQTEAFDLPPGCALITAISAIAGTAPLRFNVFPNPGNSRFTVRLDGRAKSVEADVLDMQGRVVLSRTYRNTEEFQVDHQLASGAYTLVVHADGRTATDPLMIY